MASARDIQIAISDYVAHGKELCHRMRSPEKRMLNAVDLHVLRAQLRALDDEAANLEHLISKSHPIASSAQ